MKKDLIWKILMVVGICPMVFPFISFLYQMLVSESWTLLDWLIMYSFVYWPTYIIGFVLIAVSVNKLMR